jgi:penicillin-binding protein 1C
MKICLPLNEKQSFIAAMICLSVALAALFFPLPKDYLSRADVSVKIFDRNDNLLMELTPDRAGISDPVKLEDVPKSFLDLLLYSEDRRFYEHAGVSLRSIARAMYQNVRARRVVSGGSTVTQQLARTRLQDVKPFALRKLAEVWLALRIDLYFTKRDILEAYVNQVYAGNHVYGFSQAARTYFDKTLDQLTPLETAALVQTIRAPSVFDLYRATTRVEERAKFLLQRYAAAGYMTPEELALDMEEPVRIRPFGTEVAAPHFCLWVYDEAKKLVPRGTRIAEIHTTLDLELYNAFLNIVRDRMRRLESRNVNQASILFVDNASMEILVMLGSQDFFGERGQINGVFIRRQPGSTMTAFTYALALESEKFTAATILPDVFLEFQSPVGKYVPQNYDRRYHGPVRLAMALGCSYNVPAVWTVDRLGLEPYYAFLKRAGFDSLVKPARFYGLGLTLGNADVTLYELTRGYTMFPNGGMLRQPRGILYVLSANGKYFEPRDTEAVRLISPETAFLMSRLLSEFKYKAPAFGVNSPINFPFPVAVKTGTTKDFRDNTVVAWSTRWTMGIWAGNFTGEPMRETPSASGSALFLRDIVQWMYNLGLPIGEPFSYDGLDITLEYVCPLSGMKPGPNCPDKIIEYFRRGTEPTQECTWHAANGIVMPQEFRQWSEANLPGANVTITNTGRFRIISPRQGDVYRLDPDVQLQSQQIRFETTQTSETVEWYVNGEFFAEGNRLYWQLRTGEFTIEARAGEEKSSVRIVVVN